MNKFEEVYNEKDKNFRDSFKIIWQRHNRWQLWTHWIEEGRRRHVDLLQKGEGLKGVMMKNYFKDIAHTPITKYWFLFNSS